MGAQPFSKISLSRRSALAAAGVVMLPGVAVLTASESASAGFNLIWNEWGPLAGYQVSTECNPGGHTSFPCGQSDVAIDSAGDATGRFSEVTANPRGITTFVNAIGNIHFVDTTPDGQPLRLTTYRYLYAIRLPRIPTKSSAPWIGEQIHQMIQFWDGSNKLWQANKHTLEASIFWKLNPWDPDFGKIFVYTTNSSGGLAAVDTGITLAPDTNWHVFDVRADLLNRVFAGIAIDNQWNPLTNLPLAQVQHTDWGGDLSLILTAESENAYPGATNPIVTQWTTDFKDPKLYRLD
jgi:hypothetical protein